jgi:glycosyltransferase involved in cell wall biosynthesis
MKIGIDARFLIPNKMEGFGVYTLELCKALAAQHPDQTFYLFIDRYSSFQIKLPPNCKRILIPIPARLPILWRIWYEIFVPIYAFFLGIDVFVATIGFVPKGRFKKLSIVHDINFEHFPNTIPKPILSFYQKHFKNYCAKADHIIAISEFTKQDLIQTYQLDAKHISVVYNGARQVRSHTHSELNVPPYFMVLGSLHPRKNIEGVIKAFELYKQTDTLEAELRIIGAGLFEKQAFNKYAISDSIKPYIHFMGRLSDEEVFVYLTHAKALLFLPLYEGFGLPIVEAMSVGTPVISSNNSSLPEVCGNAALLFDATDHSSIAKGMHNLLEDMDLKSDLVEKGFTQAKRFTWAETAKGVYEQIQQLHA